MTSSSAPETRSHLESSGTLARRVRNAFARISIVATVACALLLFLLLRVAGSVRDMQRDETAIRTGLVLATAVREQYIHVAHTVILGNDSHLEHYTEWVARVQTGARELRQRVADGDRWRVTRIASISEDIDGLFRRDLLPAVLKGESSRVAEAHRYVEEQMEIAADDADIVARSVEARMSSEHVGATQLAHAGVSVAVLGIVTLIALSVLSTRSLRQALLRPLGMLADAAARIGSGDLQTRPSVAAEGELGLVSRAFEQMGRQLLEHQRRLIATERMAAIGQLAAGVAHEINNPIAVIRGYLRTMIPEAERESLRKELAILDEEAAACQRITEDLLDYARSPELNRVPLDAAAFLESTAERFRASGESRGTDVHIHATHAEVAADPIRLRQVLQNLLRNAAQAAPAGSTIELCGDVTANTYRIRVLDRGIGIPDELGARIFEPFMSGRSGGSGLGLAVCSGIIRAHGGEIGARPRDGGGSEFFVDLPRSPVDTEEARG